MEIQTFEVEEQVGGTTPEIEAEALDLIEKLGLEGQRELINPDTSEPERFQYPEMTAQETAVYEAIFPAKTKLQDYSTGILPVRVLQVAAHAGEFCDTLFVWHKEVTDPDPLLVGNKDNKRYMLARWGDGLKDFKELVIEAREILLIKFAIKLKKNLTNTQRDLVNVADLVEEHLGGGYVYIP